MLDQCWISVIYMRLTLYSLRKEIPELRLVHGNADVQRHGLCGPTYSTRIYDGIFYASNLLL